MILSVSRRKGVLRLRPEDSFWLFFWYTIVRKRLLDEARAVEEAGAFAVVLECVPQALAEKITKSIHIPTIGIGAGAGCDGQVLVYQDMLGMYSDMVPKFAKQYAQVGTQMKEAFAAYRKEVADGTFPAPEHTFKMDETILDKLY